ncbi:MAG: four helix bundle protein [Candidatus Curtissbacteria bacterium]
MDKIQNTKKYDLEERTFIFARDCRDFVKKLPKTIANIEYGKQLIRSSGSPAANYIEANESLSKKDFVMRVKICRKEVKESRLWLKLYDTGDSQDLEEKRKSLITESTELLKIFSSIIEKSK